MKKTSKFFAVLLSLVMVMSVTVALTSCSSGPATLEDYIADHPEEREALEESKSSYASMEGINFDIQVKDNTIIYLFEMENTVNQSIASEMKTAFENLMESFGYCIFQPFIIELD